MLLVVVHRLLCGSECFAVERKIESSLFSPVVSCCVVVLLAQVLEYLKKHHEFDKTSASQEDRSVA